MKNALLTLTASVALLAQAAPARATSTAAVPADTVAGHAHMVRRITREMCAALTADHTTNFQTLTQPQAAEYVQKLLMPALLSDSASLMNMARLGARQNMSPQDIGRQVGFDAFSNLRRDCAAAQPLVSRLAQTMAAPAPVAPAPKPTAPAAAPKRKPAARPSGR